MDVLVISNRTRAARSFDFEITRMISDQTALHSVQLPLLIIKRIKEKRTQRYQYNAKNSQALRLSDKNT